MVRYLLLLLLSPLCLFAQKKPLDHTVYDGWQGVGERMISNDGKWVVYTITPQEGDAQLYIQGTDGGSYKKEVPRGYSALITEDSKYAVFRIRPTYKETRDARIKKKKPEEMPKDSFAIVELGKEPVWKVAKVKTYKTPDKAAGFVAYHKEREVVAARGTPTPTQKTVDSLRKTIDSLVLLVKEIKNVKAGNADALDADEEPSASSSANEGSDLVLRKLSSGTERTFKNVVDYYFNKYGQKLMMRIAKSPRDTSSRNGVLMYDLAKEKLDTILRGGNDFKGFAFSEDGSKAAFVAERDTATKALQRFYQLYVYNGQDSAQPLVSKATSGMQVGTTVSEWSNVAFSKSGNRLFFGTAAILPPRDTTLVDIDLVKLDVWHYNDDYLQTQQLFGLNTELRRNYLAVFDFPGNKMEQLASKAVPTIIQTGEGDGAVFIATTDTGRRVQRQWGVGRTDVYAVEVGTGNKTLVKKNLEGQIYASSTGKYILLYDNKQKHYFAWDGKSLKNVTSKIPVPLYNEENDTPNDPGPYGIMGWHEGDSAVYVYDKYDVWRVPMNGGVPQNFTQRGRPAKDTYRYLRVNAEERSFVANQPLFFRVQNEITKETGFRTGRMAKALMPEDLVAPGKYFVGALAKAENAPAIIYTKESYTASPNLYLANTANPVARSSKSAIAAYAETRLSNTNAQQASFNWGTAELFKWKTFSGKTSEGILYKPEDFNPAKKYPMIIYFYEKLSDGLYSYQAPAPTPSRLNISFYVSRGYLVFAPDISYTRGGTGPGKDAYDYIVSGAQALAKNPWVDAKNMAIQGQSWGGYQVAHLITRTSMFKAAWAGAPVVNMTSAYGGIRWESGVTRQFQYEKGQSRIGSSIWEKQNLYIENSPLFFLPKVTTPVVIMSNDADGAVPWQQGIEMFTALRRLNKKVWLLNYNGEAHNLVERKNRKDIQVRQQQFFDHMLKGAKPSQWIVEGVPAVEKGKNWGLGIVDK
jgi:dipeptidyl aminopeptidase/acylaminoacyl peptidase